MPLKVMLTRSGLTLSQDGLDITFDAAYAHGTYVDGSIYVVAPAGLTITRVAISNGESSNLVLGAYSGDTQARIMVDPQGLEMQGWDDRVSGFGPGLIFDHTLGYTLPHTVTPYAVDKPITVWFYRGLDAVQVGGQYGGTYALVQITVCGSAPAANSIKPPGMYVAAGKPQHTQSDINYSAFSTTAIPGGASEPDWSIIGRYHVRPMVNTGLFASGRFVAVCNPTMHREIYPADQMLHTHNMCLGIISNSASRNTLIDRFVRDGLDMYASLAFDVHTYEMGAGYGTTRAPMFWAGVFLNDSNMMAKPAQHFNSYVSSTVTLDIFGDDGCCQLGAADGTYPNGKPLYGSLHVANWDTVSVATTWPDNHDLRDPSGSSATREAHWLSVSAVSGTARSGSHNTIQFKAGTPSLSPIEYEVYIVSGPGAGETNSILSWDDTNKIATMRNDWVVSGGPTSSSVYEYYNGGFYQFRNFAFGGYANHAMAILLAGKGTQFGNNTFLKMAKRWIDEDGKLTPRYVPSDATVDAYWQAGNTNFRRFGDQPGAWGATFYSATSGLWPTP